MGYKIAGADARGYDFESRFCSIGIVRAEGASANRAHDLYSAGLHHIAWRAESRADVDAMHDLLVGIGARVLDAPADYPEYGAGYYAVFFADPDGLKLEFVFKP